MLPREIQPAQLKALLLLLVLVPLIPTVLLIRLMLETASAERDTARERSATLYRQALELASGTLARRLPRERPANPEEVDTFFRDWLGSDAVVRLVDAGGKTLIGEAGGSGSLVVSASLAEAGLPWEVHLHLDEPASGVQSQRDLLTGIAASIGPALAGILAIAALAALTLQRQFALRDLKSSSLATVAHEIRTPLATIRMLVDTLREKRIPDPAQQAEYLELIAVETVRLTRLTENFLTASRLERHAYGFRWAILEPADVGREAVEALRSRLQAPECHFTEHYENGSAYIRADRTAMVTVLINLLDNALKYTGSEKIISLRVTNSDADVTFAVSDNGTGVEKGDFRTIFKPFHRADQRLSRTTDGCGLGLSIVKQIAEAHGGSVRVKSESGTGSTFLVTIPKVTAHDGDPSDRQQTEDGASLPA